MKGLARLRGQLFVALQFLLPRQLLTRAAWRLARIRTPFLKNAIIRGFVRLFGVDTNEALRAVPEGYSTFNEFFIRELIPGARPVDSTPRTIVSPVDGTLSAAGHIDHDRIFQAKGLSYTLTDLLASDLDDARSFEFGEFATIYLAPYNYHRVHAPFGGRLTALHYVPGDLFSVNEATVSFLPRLFARNERLICRFDTDFGPMAVIFVGAMNVGSISTPWTGEVRPRSRGVVEAFDVSRLDHPLTVERGELLGWFSFGSTVILLLPRGACELDSKLIPGRRLRMGEAIARHGGITS